MNTTLERSIRQYTTDLRRYARALVGRADEADELVQECLVRALSYLPNEQREVVLMVGLEGMSYQQTADALDIPVGTVMSRLSRGRATLRHLTDGKKRMPALPVSVTPVRRSHLRVV